MSQCFHTMEVNGLSNCLVTNILQNIFFGVPPGIWPGFGFVLILAWSLQPSYILWTCLHCFDRSLKISSSRTPQLFNYVQFSFTLLDKPLSVITLSKSNAGFT